MFVWLENLRRAPEGRKARAAFLLAFVGTFIIFVFWAIAFGNGTLAELENNQNRQAANPITGLSETFSKAIEGMAGTASSIGDQLNKIQNDFMSVASSSISSVQTNQTTPSDQPAPDSVDSQ